MPDAETSRFHHPSDQLQPSNSSTKPLESQEVHLLVVEDDKGRREIPLGGEVYSIGRDPGCDIRLFSMFVSRRHATLVRRRREDGNYDYQIFNGSPNGQPSANGILIHGRKLQNYDLKNDDKVVFGPGVSAKYQRLKRNERKSGPLDPFDITLFDPGMVDNAEK